MSLVLAAYRLAWWLTWPLVAAASWLHPRLRVGWRQRWALELPGVEPGAILVHGASVGEGQAAAGVAGVLAGARPRRVVLRTATTDTGLATARGHDALSALPLDAPFAVRRFLDHLRPRALVLVESELWPHLLLAARARNIPVVVVGARLGRGTRRWLRWPRTWALLERCVTTWAAKTPAAAEELRPHVSGEVVVGGEPKELAPIGSFPFELPRPLVVGASTRPGDERALLDALPDGAHLLLAPRHPDRFDEVAALVEQPWRRSVGLPPDGARVLVLDTLGELSGALQQADVAFIGGTFDAEIGGHSPVEAARAGAVVVHGPHTWSNQSAWDGLGTLQCDSPAALGDALGEALTRGRTVQHASSGSVLSELLAPLLDAPVPAEATLRPWLAPLGWAYAALAAARVARLGAGVRAAVPIVAVGNLASGGAGKTPVVAWFSKAIAERGLKPAVVARGYGRAEGPEVRVVRGPEDGDELAMLAGHGHLAISAPDRLAGAALAVARGADVVVLDDAFQHRAIARDHDVVVVDARHPAAGGPLPAGEAREGIAALDRADLIWVQNGPLPAGLPARPWVQARQVPIGWLRGGELAPLESLHGEVVAFAGIAHPGRFLEQLVALGLRVVVWRTFPDHHRFTRQELAELAAHRLPLVTTEKDLVRLPADLDARALRVELEVVRGQELLVAMVDDLVARCERGG